MSKIVCRLGFSKAHVEMSRDVAQFSLYKILGSSKCSSSPYIKIPRNQLHKSCTSINASGNTISLTLHKSGCSSCTLLAQEHQCKWKFCTGPSHNVHKFGFLATEVIAIQNLLIPLKAPLPNSHDFYVGSQSLGVDGGSPFLRALLVADLMASEGNPALK